MNKVYLAARYGRREEICEYRSVLHERGLTVTSRWLNGEHEIHDKNPNMYAQFANEDFADILAADTMISFTDGPDFEGWVRGGRHVEFGLAIALPSIKSSIVIGERENVFHYLPGVMHFPSFSDFIGFYDMKESYAAA